MLGFVDKMTKSDTWQYYDNLVPGWCMEWEKAGAEWDVEWPPLS